MGANFKMFGSSIPSLEKRDLGRFDFSGWDSGVSNPPGLLC